MMLCSLLVEVEEQVSIHGYTKKPQNSHWEDNVNLGETLTKEVLI